MDRCDCKPGFRRGYEPAGRDSTRHDDPGIARAASARRDHSRHRA